MSIPVYISVTSIFQNQDILVPTLNSILKQTVIPDKIFVYLSEEEYLLDSGFPNRKITDSKLANLIRNSNDLIEIKWVKNTGPYRKLLPLMKEKWNEDCIIITIDDDTLYDKVLVETYLNVHKEHDTCVIGSRGWTPNFNDFKDFNYHLRNPSGNELSSLVSSDGVPLFNFLTGKGGILYKPSFFRKTGDLIFDESIYLNTNPTQDDIWFYVIRVLNGTPCHVCNTNGTCDAFFKDSTHRTGLFVNFNHKDDANSKGFRKLYDALKQSYSFRKDDLLS